MSLSQAQEAWRRLDVVRDIREEIEALAFDLAEDLYEKTETFESAQAQMIGILDRAQVAIDHAMAGLNEMRRGYREQDRAYWLKYMERAQHEMVELRHGVKKLHDFKRFIETYWETYEMTEE
ncbi:MAG: hypothetical protein ACYSUI_05555 [Planctomycetota bacterium]|jgi:hypothetical protein